MSRWAADEMGLHANVEEDSDEEEAVASGHKAKPRRKSHQRPQGSDQIRQAFSKRKKGLVLKAYQLNSLTDAKVFMFIVNDKGTAWAYATPGFNNSLNPQLLQEMRCLADVPDHAKLFTEVIACPSGAKNTSSRGSSEQTGTQRTEPSAEFAPPSTRTATGSLPSRSRSSYSWGSDGQAPGPQGVDKLTRTASNAATARAAQATPQSDEHSPVLPKARPPSGSSMACNTRASMAAPGTGFSYQHYPHHAHHHNSHSTQQGAAAAAAGGGGVGGARNGGLEPPTPCGVYDLLGQPTSGQDSPSEVAMSCGGGSPSSKLMPPPDAAATGRMLAANAAAAAAAAAAAGGGGAGDAQGAAAAAAGMGGGYPGVGPMKAEAMVGDWAPQGGQLQQQLQEGGSSWDFGMYQQQQYMQQQQFAMQQELARQQQQMYASQQQQQYMQQQQYQQQPPPLQQQQQQQGPSGSFFMPVGPSSTDGDAPYSAAGAGGQAGVMSWGSLPTGLGAGLLAADQNTTNSNAMQIQQQQGGGGGGSQDPFEAMQRGLAPLKLAKPFRQGVEPDGARSAPAAAGAMKMDASAGGSMAGMSSMQFGPPSQWVHFPDSAGRGVGGGDVGAAGNGGLLSGMRTTSDAGVYGGYGSSAVFSGSGYGPSPSSNQTSGAGSTPAAGAGPSNAAQAMLMAHRGGSLSQGNSPTAALSQRMTSVLAVNSPTESPLHPSAVAEQQAAAAQAQQQQQAAMWGSHMAMLMGGNSSCPSSQDGGAAGYQLLQQQQQLQHQQHNQGEYMPQTDDLLSDPIVEMLMDQPLGQLAAERKASSTGEGGHAPRHLSIMEATLQQQPQQSQQQQMQQQQMQDMCGVLLGPGSGSGATGGCWEGAATQAQQAAAGAPQQPPPAGDGSGGGNSSSSNINLLAQIPPPPKSDADKAAWQAQVRRILGTLAPQQRQELLKLSQQQLITESSGGGGGSTAAAAAAAAGGSGGAGCGPTSGNSGFEAMFACSGPPSAAQPAGAPPVQQQQQASAGAAASTASYGRGFGGKQRLGPRQPSRLSATTPALDLAGAADNEAAAAAAGLQQQQQLPVGTTVFMKTAASSGGAAGGEAAGCAGSDAAMGPPGAGMAGAGDALEYICSTAGLSTQLPLSACMPAMQGAPFPGAEAFCSQAGVAACSFGMPVSGGGGGSGEMLPLPQQQLSDRPAAVLGPVLTSSGGSGGSASTSSAATPFAPGMQGGPSNGSAFMQAAAAAGRARVLQSDARGSRSCPGSPLKRSQPSSGAFGGAAAGAVDDSASPMKKHCTATAFSGGLLPQQPQQQQALPEPPSFATLLQAEASGEDDAIAWATAVAASDSMRRAGGSCVSLGGVSNAAFGSLESFPSAFLRWGSLPGVDSMQVLPTVPDGAAAGPGEQGATTADAAGAGNQAAQGGTDGPTPMDATTTTTAPPAAGEQQ